MTDPIFVSYFSPGYESVALRLRDSLETLDLPHRIDGIPDQGGWAPNVRYRTSFLRQMLDLHPGRPIVWIDADALVRKRPELFWHLDADLAACRWEWPDRPLDEILAGTVYLANNDRSRAFLDVWESSRAETGSEMDEPALKLAIERMPDLRFVSLPVEYTFIFDIHRGFFPEADPVIEHFQESRKQRA